MSWDVFEAVNVVLAMLAVVLIAMWRELRLGQQAIKLENLMLYRFCFLDAHDRIVATEEIEVRSLLDAIARAHMMLEQRPHHVLIEVWQGNKRAYRAGRDRAA